MRIMFWPMNRKARWNEISRPTVLHDIGGSMAKSATPVTAPSKSAKSKAAQTSARSRSKTASSKGAGAPREKAEPRKGVEALLAEQGADAGGVIGHGVARLPSVVVDSYNLEIRDKDGFVGDRASGRAFRTTLDSIRKALRKTDEDPLGDKPTDHMSKATFDKLLSGEDAVAAGVIHGAVEQFASELAYVIKRFLKSKSWKGVKRICVGGGLKESRVGELAVGRTMVILKTDGIDIDLETIRHHPDEAGLIGCAHLAPAWVYQGYDSIMAVDVGGSNIRCGIVDFNLDDRKDLSKAAVWKAGLWRHRDDAPNRDEAVTRLTDMLADLVRQADANGRRLCPLIAIGVPGVINPDGSIARGGQNLPGNWESSRFNLAESVQAAIPTINGHQTAVVIHNDAVVQGLSQTPFMQDVLQWGVLTIGTGLGNACFSNRTDVESQKKQTNKKNDKDH